MAKVRRTEPSRLARAWGWMVFVGIVALLLCIPMMKFAVRVAISRLGVVVLLLGVLLIWLGMIGRRKRHEEQ